MRSQPPGVMSLHDAVTLCPTKTDENKLSDLSSPVFTSDPVIALDCENLSPTSKCSDWKQKNEVLFPKRALRKFLLLFFSWHIDYF